MPGKPPRGGAGEARGISRERLAEITRSQSPVPLAAYEMACDRARFWERLAWTFMGTTLLAIFILFLTLAGLGVHENAMHRVLWAEVPTWSVA